MDGSPSQPTPGRGRRPPARSRGRGGRARPDAVLRRAAAGRRSAGDPAGPLGREPGRPRRASGCPRAWRPSRRSTASCAPGRPTFRLIPPARPCAPPPSSPPAASRRSWSPAALAPALREAWAGPGPLPRLILVEAAGTGLRRGPRSDVRTPRPESPPGDASGPRSWPTTPPPRCPPARRRTTWPTSSSPRARPASPRESCSRMPMPSRFWTGASETLGPWTDDDRFSSHAPFHFDLSVFDLFVSCRNAATLVLIGESLAKEPASLGDFLASRRISVWYSAPSILALLTEHGGLDRPGFRRPGWCSSPARSSPSARSAGCRQLWPQAQLLEPLRADRDQRLHRASDPRVDPRGPDRRPIPIGTVCPPLRARVVDEEGRDVPAGTLGELVIAGPGVMRGYFGQPELTARAFFVDERRMPLVPHRRPGRRRRIGLLPVPRPPRPHGQEARLPHRAGRDRVGALPPRRRRPGGRRRPGRRRRASRSPRSSPSSPTRRRSIIAMKRHCTTYLPHYMVPDTITFVNSLPATSTDKVDYQTAQGHDRGARAMTAESARPPGLLPGSSSSTSSSCRCSRLLGPARCVRPAARPGASPGEALAGAESQADRGPPETPSRGSDLDGPIDALWPELAANAASFPGPRLPARHRARTRRRSARFEVRGDEQLRQRARRRHGRDPGRQPHGGLHPLPALALPQGPAGPRTGPAPRHVSAHAESAVRRGAGLIPPGRPVPPPRALARGRDRASWSGPGPPSESGMAVYLCGDIPWHGPERHGPAGCSGASSDSSPSGPSSPSSPVPPVFHVFCTHLPGGRFRLELEGVGRIHCRRGGRRGRRSSQAARSPDRQRPGPGRRPPALALLRSHGRHDQAGTEPRPRSSAPQPACFDSRRARSRPRRRSDRRGRPGGCRSREDRPARRGPRFPGASAPPRGESPWPRAPRDRTGCGSVVR